MAACEEESWLEEYNQVEYNSFENSVESFTEYTIVLDVSLFLDVQDENRYNAGRGTHLILKRAEKARNLVSRLPGNLFSNNYHPISFFFFCIICCKHLSFIHFCNAASLFQLFPLFFIQNLFCKNCILFFQ